MMFNLILIVILLLGMIIGLKRGFILQFFHLIGFFAAFYLATQYYDKITPHLILWIPYPDLIGESEHAWVQMLEIFPLEDVFYHVVSFSIIFFGAKIALQIIASMLDFVAELPILNWINKLMGVLLGFMEVYLIMFIFLFIFAITPIPILQTWINESNIALFIIEKTPYLSEKVKSLWLHMRL